MSTPEASITPPVEQAKVAPVHIPGPRPVPAEEIIPTEPADPQMDAIFARAQEAATRESEELAATRATVREDLATDLWLAGRATKRRLEAEDAAAAKEQNVKDHEDFLAQTVASNVFRDTPEDPADWQMERQKRLATATTDLALRVASVERDMAPDSWDKPDLVRHNAALAEVIARDGRIDPKVAAAYKKHYVDEVYSAEEQKQFARAQASLEDVKRRAEEVRRRAAQGDNDPEDPTDPKRGNNDPNKGPKGPDDPKGPTGGQGSGGPAVGRSKVTTHGTKAADKVGGDKQNQPPQPPRPPRTPEEQKKYAADLEDALRAIAKAEKDLHMGAGKRGKEAKSEALTQAHSKLKELIEQSSDDPHARLRLKAEAMKELAKYQLELSEIPKKRHTKLQKIANHGAMKWFKNHKKLVYGAALVTAVVTTLATGGAAAVAIGAAKGGLSGGIAGTAVAGWTARVGRILNNTREAIQSRVDVQQAEFKIRDGETYEQYSQRVYEALHGKAVAAYEENTATRNKMVKTAARNGLIGGVAMGGAFAGLIHLGTLGHAAEIHAAAGPTPDQVHQIHDGIAQGMTNNTHTFVNHAHHTFTGHDYWQTIQNHGPNGHHLSGAATQHQLTGTETTLHSNGFHFTTHNAHFDAHGHFTPDSSTYWDKVTAPEGGRVLLDAQGHHVANITGTLDNPTHGAISDVLAHGGHFATNPDGSPATIASYANTATQHAVSGVATHATHAAAHAATHAGNGFASTMQTVTPFVAGAAVGAAEGVASANLPEVTAAPASGRHRANNQPTSQTPNGQEARSRQTEQQRVEQLNAFAAQYGRALSATWQESWNTESDEEQAERQQEVLANVYNQNPAAVNAARDAEIAAFVAAMAQSTKMNEQQIREALGK